MTLYLGHMAKKSAVLIPDDFATRSHSINNRLGDWVGCEEKFGEHLPCNLGVAGTADDFVIFDEGCGRSVLRTAGGLQICQIIRISA